MYLCLPVFYCVCDPNSLSLPVRVCVSVCEYAFVCVYLLMYMHVPV